MSKTVKLDQFDHSEALHGFMFGRSYNIGIFYTRASDNEMTTLIALKKLQESPNLLGIKPKTFFWKPTLQKRLLLSGLRSKTIKLDQFDHFKAPYSFMFGRSWNITIFNVRTVILYLVLWVRDHCRFPFSIHVFIPIVWFLGIRIRNVLRFVPILNIKLKHHWI